MPRETIGLQEATSGTLTHERRAEKAAQSTHHKEHGKTHSFSKNAVSDKSRLIPGACSTPSERNSSDKWAEARPRAAEVCRVRRNRHSEGREAEPLPRRKEVMDLQQVKMMHVSRLYRVPRLNRQQTARYFNAGFATLSPLFPELMHCIIN